MKRAAGFFVTTWAVPLAVFFVLTAGPARLYAETAPPPPACTAPEIEACSGKDGGACVVDGSVGVCMQRLCMHTDGSSPLVVDTAACVFLTPADANSDADASSDANPDGSNNLGTVGDADDEAIVDESGTTPADSGKDSSANTGPVVDAQSPTSMADALSSEADAGAPGASASNDSGGGGCSAAGSPLAGATHAAAGLFFGVWLAFGARRRASRT